MREVFSEVQTLFVLYGLKIVAAAAIFFIGKYTAKSISNIGRRLLRKNRTDETLVSFVSSLSYIIIMVVVVNATLEQLGVETTSFVAILGAAGLAIGLALQGSLANFAAGILMLIFSPFRVGDYIEGGGVSGTVAEIGLFTTNLKSPDNKTIIVPNSKLTSDNIINYTAKEIRRVDIKIGVSYNDDIDKVRKVLVGILAQDGRILNDPAPFIGILELADSSVNFAVRPWVKTADYWDVFFALQESIKKQFDAANISIPFPQCEVHVNKMN